MGKDTQRFPTQHRPWPLPRRPWAMSMVWKDLAFLHWAVDPAALAPRIPDGLTLDVRGGQAWVGVVPFAMEAVCPRWTPRIPPLSDFLELNLRTYVTCQQKPGVFFFSLDAASWLGVRVARRGFHLPYFDARMQCEQDSDSILYRSRRTHRGCVAAGFQARYEPTGAPFPSVPGSLEHWLTERYCLYASSPSGRLFRGDIHHAPWPLQQARCEVMENTLGEPFGIALPGPPALAHFARHLPVRAWLLEAVAAPTHPCA